MNGFRITKFGRIFLASCDWMFTGECRWCEFRKGVCEVGRRPGVARAALEFAPWNPLEG